VLLLIDPSEQLGRGDLGLLTRRDRLAEPALLSRQRVEANEDVGAESA
jgi:hypothetical protein